MKRKRVILLVVAVLAAAGALGWWLGAKRKDKPLVLSGTIEARDVEVGSLLGGRIAKIFVEEGAAVAAGAPILQFETDLIDLQISQQKAKIAQAQANLTKALRGPRTEEISSARALAENAETERLRQKRLLGEGVVPQQSYDAAATQARTTREALLELQRGNRPEDISAAKATLEAEEKQAGYLERQRAESAVKAPAAGVIESMELRPGDLVGPNQPVARILEPGQIWVRVYVPEPQLGRVRVGQRAAIKVDTWPHREFSGKVVEIRTQSEYTPRNVQTLDQRMDQVFGVKVAIDPAPELKPGMAATVRLVE
ncbi:MAG TPA: HlyD family efflux transporter periplasmic adaptor subunit [Thermoanaerobaculia bacterium]|nr:HlyD family efflux transporter periplasmic adaptor subunit [Thermoanaerobaculia bacterium]